MTSDGDALWTTRRLLEWITGFLEEKGIDKPRVDAERLKTPVVERHAVEQTHRLDRVAHHGLVVVRPDASELADPLGHVWRYRLLATTRVPLGEKQHLHLDDKNLPGVIASGTVLRTSLYHLWTRI